jgi:RNA polymerase sigma-70 factor (ECF subfamily)
MDWERLRPHDEAILNDIADGDYRRALGMLVRGYQQAMVGFCYNMLGEDAWAEETAQDIFLDAYKAMPRFRQQASVRTWLFAIARNKCLQVRRNRDRRGRIQQNKQEIIAQSAHREPPAAAEEHSEAMLQLVRQGLEQLPDAERELLAMRYDTGLSVADIAQVRGMSMATVRRRLARALEALREVVDSEA